MISRWTWLALAVACHDPAPAPIAPAPVGPAPIAASPPLPAAAPDPTLPPPPVEPKTPDACVGDSIDLLALRKIDACATTAKLKIPDSVALSIEPTPIAIKAGKTFAATLVVTNPTSRTVDLVVNDSCSALSKIETSMLDGDGRRVDEGPVTCGGVNSCDRSELAFALKPGGKARLPFVVDARVMVFKPEAGGNPLIDQLASTDDSCTPHRSNRAVKPGAYDLVVDSPLGKVHDKVRVR